MTREEARKTIDDILACFGNKSEDGAYELTQLDAKDMREAIQALSAAPSIASASEWCRQHGYVMMPESVYEQDITKAYFEGQNSGWIMNICPNCGAINASAYRNYCPNCGAKMTESEEV